MLAVVSNGRSMLFAAAVAALAVWLGPADAHHAASAAGCGPGTCLRVDAIAGGAVDETATVSGAFDVDVVAQGSGGQIGAFNFTLSYNRTVLSAAPPSTAGLPSSVFDCTLPPASGALPEDNLSADHDPATGDAFISCFAYSALSVGDGPIARIHFTVIGSGTSALTLHNASVGSPEGVELLTCEPVITNPGGSCMNASVSTGGGGAPPPPPPGGGGTCDVAYAIDGETVRCADGSRLRFIGVGSPLGAEPGAAWATALTNWFLAGRTVRIEQDVTPVDEFGQRYGYPHVTGTDGHDYNISVLIVYIGMAHHVFDGTNGRYNDWIAASETWARTACWNMWAAGNPFAAESGCH